MKLLRILATLLAVTLPVAAFAQDNPATPEKPAAPSSEAAPKLDGENLLVGVPDGYVLGDKAQGDTGLVGAEFIPKDETVDDWTSMITVQIFRGVKLGPDGFADQLKTGWEGACANSKVERLGEGRVNGYRYSAWYYVCPLNPKTNKPETMWLKAIRGNDALYSVQYAFRAAPDDKRKATADKYLAAASACDTTKPKHPCPAEK
jgi:hypothetical protein